MELIAAGRDSDVFSRSDRWVLRRYRDGRSAEREAAILRDVHALGYPVPRIESCSGPAIVMERVAGPTMAEAVVAGADPVAAGAELAALHERLHALAWPVAGPGECVLHLDLHPLNVLMGAGGPVVTDGMLESVGIPADAVDELGALLRSFAERAGPAYVDHLPAAEALRRQDRYQTPAELAELPRAVALARAQASG